MNTSILFRYYFERLDITDEIEKILYQEISEMS